MISRNTKLAREFSAWISGTINEPFSWSDSLQSVKDNADKLDYIMPCLLSCVADGELKIDETDRTAELFAICRENDLPMMPLTAGDPEVVAAVMDSAALRRSHTAALLDYVCDRGFIGLDVDYEFMPEELKDAFTEFMREVTTEFGKFDKLVSLDLHPKVRPDDPWSIGARAQDWTALARFVPILRVMCYDQYCPAYNYAEPGPPSTLIWSEAVITYAIGTIPLDKLIMGLPFYGYDFDTVDRTKSRYVLYSEVERLKKEYGAREEWHELYCVPHFDFTDAAGHRHEVWYANGRSTRARAAIATKYGVRGVSCWVIADEDENVWSAVAEGLGK